jgi:hypothetical protein
MSDSTVMLSTFATLSVNSAKYLVAQRERPFAALRVTSGSYIADKGIDSERERPFAALRVTGEGSEEFVKSDNWR